ncbi:ficolin-1-like [Anopheles nili]|uniref:ficolin-1-like n=1 Tax=Anopheles nili TaxID=185578 RepID=UPI00237A601F|nr:ficolin-1-like [Anopheles nili]
MDLVMKQQSQKQMQQQALLDDLLWAVNQLNEVLGRNITLLRRQTESILMQQSACSNNEQLQLNNLIRSCKEKRSSRSGKYMLLPEANIEPFEVLCEQSSWSGGWLVFQQRIDGKEDFNRGWDEYRNGFGSLDHDFWMGLERLHQITSSGSYEMLVELRDFLGNYEYAWYKEFEIGSEAEDYLLKKIVFKSGSAGDSLTQHKGLKFLTFDRDTGGKKNFAAEYEGAWWMQEGHFSHLNGRRLMDAGPKSMFWYSHKESEEGMAVSRMMIRESESEDNDD